MNEVFGQGEQDDQKLRQRIENRSLATHDIQGARAKRNILINADQIAGVRTGSPTRKNESSVFSHLTDNYGRDQLKKKEVDIPKPRVVNNDLSAKKLPVQEYNQQ